MRFSAKRWAYSDIPSEVSHTAIVDIIHPERCARESIVAATVKYQAAETDHPPPDP